MRTRGFSLLEALVTLGVLAILAAAAVPSVGAARDEARARGAAHHLASLLHLARLEALKRHAHVAVRFEPDQGDVRCAFYADGNGNGVRTAEILAGVDRVVRPGERLSYQFGTDVRFGIQPGVEGIDGDDLGGDPIGVGRSRMISFGPTGTSTSGTVYLLGRGSRQFAVRVLGPTGRIRTFEYWAATREWRTR